MNPLLTNFIAWGVSFATQFTPLDAKIWYPNNEETVVVRQARYESIEADMLKVVFEDPKPPIFGGPQGRLFTWTLMNAIAKHEGSFRRDVDLGLGKYAGGDKGNSVCLMQINIGTGFVEVDGEKWFGKDLIADRTKCFRAGLARMRESLSACAGNPKRLRLAGYTSGKCGQGHKAAGEIYDMGTKWFGAHMPDFTDQDVLDALKVNDG